jgi:hypothetical protein
LILVSTERTNPKIRSRHAGFIRWPSIAHLYKGVFDGGSTDLRSTSGEDSQEASRQAHCSVLKEREPLDKQKRRSEEPASR